jgi:hypothetical protein
MVRSTRHGFIIAAALVGCILAGIPSFAQEQETSAESRRTAKFGVKAGVNFSNLYISNVQNENLKMGENVGIFAKLPVARGISIQPELLYSNKGAKDTYNNFLQGQGEYRYNLNYLELPLLLVFNLTRNFSLSGGGYAAYLLSANVKDENNNGTINGVTNLNANNFNRVDYGLVGGASFDIGNITLGARYNYGLQTIGNTGSLSGELTKNSKNSVSTIFIGFAF